MSVKLVIMMALLCYTLRGFAASDEDAATAFAFSGLGSANLSLSGIAELNPNGLLKLTNGTRNRKGQAFHPKPFNLKNNSTNGGSALSFSTSFVVAIVPEYRALGGGHGLAFVITPTRGLPGGSSGLYLGVLNDTNNGNFTNHVVAVELDTIDSREFQDINGNHVGIDINRMESEVAKPAGYYANASWFQNLSLVSGHRMQVWVEYDGLAKIINVTLAPVDDAEDKPKIPLLSLEYDLSPILNQAMYIGFSSSTGSIPASHYVLGWSFNINGKAPRLNISQLPSLPSSSEHKKVSKLLSIGMPVSVATTLSLALIVVVYQIRKRKFAEEVLEDWEQEYGPQRFKYKELYLATKGFRESELLGSGGFGRVYRGTLQHRSRMEIAVKRVLSDRVSRLGIKTFIAEIVSMGRLRHRNLVPLLGYCRRKTELLLVYEYMENGSLDNFLFDQPDSTMSWRHRFHVIKGVASGLLYLHEEWEQVVVHRDIKSSNVLLDNEYNGKIGDFGLARLYDHGTDPHTTHVVGTRGYIAPENLRTARATTSSDVYSFGAFLLEVVCGRRPIDPKAAVEAEEEEEEEEEEKEELSLLVDWVALCWRNGEILRPVDPKLGNDYSTEEVGMVLKLGLLCCAEDPRFRPRIRQVALYLEGTVSPPDLSSLANFWAVGDGEGEGFDDRVCSCSYSNACPQHSYISNSVLSGGR